MFDYFLCGLWWLCWFVVFVCVVGFGELCWFWFEVGEGEDVVFDL